MTNSYFTVLCVGIMIVNAFFSAFSQILLKKSTMVSHENMIREYLNWRVIIAYGIFVLVLLTNAYAFQGIEYKYGSIIGALTYIFLMILSKIILKERISKKVIIGNMMIITGILIYSSNLF